MQFVPFPKRKRGKASPRGVVMKEPGASPSHGKIEGENSHMVLPPSV